MKRVRILWAVIKRIGFDKALYIFLVWFLVSAVLIVLAEPGVDTLHDALWYLFVACTSIGFGDIVAATFIGRTVTVLITIYEIILAAMFSGVVVSYYLEVVHRRENLTVTMFLEKLEHLSEMSREELVEIEEAVRKIKI